jgi:hypothetical protein
MLQGLCRCIVPSNISLIKLSIDCVIKDVEAGTGSNKKISHAHKEVLRISSFFKNALKPQLIKENEQKAIDLTDVVSATVKIYIAWLHSHDITTLPDQHDRFEVLF